MTELKLRARCGFALASALLFLAQASLFAQTPRFSSLYTNLKTECRPAIKVKRGEESGDDMPLRGKGYSRSIASAAGMKMSLFQRCSRLTTI